MQTMRLNERTRTAILIAADAAGKSYSGKPDWIKSEDARCLREEIKAILTMPVYGVCSEDRAKRLEAYEKIESNAGASIVPAFEKLQAEMASGNGPLAELFSPFAKITCSAQIWGKKHSIVFAEPKFHLDAYLHSPISYGTGWACSVVLTENEAPFFKTPAHFMEFLVTQAMWGIEITSKNMLVQLAKPDSEHWNDCICEKRICHSDQIVYDKFNRFELFFLENINYVNSFNLKHEIKDAFEWTAWGLFDAPALQATFEKLLVEYNKLLGASRSARNFKEKFRQFWPICDDFSTFSIAKQAHFFEHTKILRQTNVSGVVESTSRVLELVREQGAEKLEAFADNVYAILESFLLKNEPAQEKPNGI